MAFTERSRAIFLVVLLGAVLPLQAFVRPVPGARGLKMQTPRRQAVSSFEKESFAPELPKLGSSKTKFLAEGAALLAPLVLFANEASAKGGEYGILEGRSAALVHPIVMGTLFLLTGYSGYLGWQWRSIRTLAQEINTLKEDLPRLSDGTKVSVPVSKQIAALEASLSAEGVADAQAAALRVDLSKLKSSVVSEIDAKISQLSETRKTLLAGDFRDRHWATGSVLLGLGVTISIAGAFDTYFRAGKLFPGPHLFAGAAITVLWAAAAALVPSMQKGQEWARTLHIALNAANLLLFTWQVGTGIEILLKVVELTKWP